MRYLSVVAALAFAAGVLAVAAPVSAAAPGSGNSCTATQDPATGDLVISGTVTGKTVATSDGGLEWDFYVSAATAQPAVLAAGEFPSSAATGAFTLDTGFTVAYLESLVPGSPYGLVFEAYGFHKVQGGYFKDSSQDAVSCELVPLA